MARRKNTKRIDPRYFLHEAQERIGSLVNAALADSGLPLDTSLAGYGIAGDAVVLVPEDPKLFAQNIDDIPGAHSQYIMIMPQDMNKAGLGLEGIVDELEGIMGLQQQRIHTGAGWSGPDDDLLDDELEG